MAAPIKPVVSVIVPIYNVEKYLYDCINSICNQSLKDIEIILINDGSTDNSGSIIDDFASNDARIRALHKNNAGVSSARNDGIRIARGEYLYIMDSDDYIEPFALELMYECVRASSSDVLISDHYVFNERSNERITHLFSKEFVTEDRNVINDLCCMVLHPPYSPYPTNENNGLSLAPPWTKLVKATLIQNNNLSFDPYVEGIFDDGLFALDVFQAAKRVAYVREATYHYRELSTSLTHRYNPRRVEIDGKVFNRIEAYALRNNNIAQFMSAYYSRVVTYLMHQMTVYYFHNECDKSCNERYKELKSEIESAPYKQAICDVNISKLNLKQRIFVKSLRHKMNPIIWLMLSLVFLIREKQG